MREFLPATDEVARWFFNLSVLVDDLAVIDALLHDAVEDPGAPVSLYFRQIVTRIYEGGRVIRGMDEHVGVARFVMGIANAHKPASLLRGVYRRQPVKGERSLVERQLGTTRHLTVHLSNTSSTSHRKHERGELARILRNAEVLHPRVLIDVEEGTTRYLWGSDVLDQWLWPEIADQVRAITFTRDLTQAYVDLFKAVLPAYLARAGVERDDLWHVDRESIDGGFTPS